MVKYLIVIGSDEVGWISYGPFKSKQEAIEFFNINKLSDEPCSESAEIVTIIPMVNGAHEE